MRALLKTAIVIGIAGSPQLAHAQASGATQDIPLPVQRMMDCRKVADAASRLACFDKEAGAVSEAVSRRDLVVVDREGVRRTKRTLFGLSVPRLGLFDDGNNEVNQVEGVLSSVGNGRDGYVFVLRGDGGVWNQTDGKPIALEPVVGDKVTIRRGALGSYVLSVGRQPGVKVQRVR